MQDEELQVGVVETTVLVVETTALIDTQSSENSKKCCTCYLEDWEWLIEMVVILFLGAIIFVICYCSICLD